MISVDVGEVEAVRTALANDGAVVVTGSETTEMVEMMDAVLANARPTGRFQNARFVECVTAVLLQCLQLPSSATHHRSRTHGRVPP